MNDLTVLAPWGFAHYIALEGFPPLYSALARPGRLPLRYITKTRVTDNELRGLTAKGAQHGAGDFLAQKTINADVELHHTSPVGIGERPYVLHCEAFHPVFSPAWLPELELEPDKAQALRDEYRELFENDLCRAIVSHRQDTLQAFRSTFESPRIDAKLHHLPIGLDESYLIADAKKTHAPSLLFCNPTPSDPGQFRLYGGCIALKAALRALDAGHQFRLVLRSERPPDARLRAWGLDPERLAPFEGRSILWLEGTSPKAVMQRLVAASWALLAPGALVGSHLVLSAMMNGTVPIATDLADACGFITPGEDGVILTGARSAAEISSPFGPPTFCRDRFFALEDELASQATLALGKVIDPHQVQALSDAGRLKAATRFSGPGFARGLAEIILASGAEPMGRAGAGSIAGVPLTIDHFDGPMTPATIMNCGDFQVFQLRDRFVAVPKDKLPLCAEADFFSPANLTPRAAKRQGVLVRASIEDMALALMFRLQASPVQSGGTALSLQFPDTLSWLRNRRATRLFLAMLKRYWSHRYLLPALAPYPKTTAFLRTLYRLKPRFKQG